MKESKTILITGCRRGIGRDSALALARRGHTIIATVHREESVAELQNFAKENNVSFEVFKLDTTIAADREKIIERNIDVLINNAAIGESGSLAEIPMERIRKNFETNVFATLELSQLALKKMIARNSGHIIFISSIAGRLPMPFWGSYCMTKYALSAGADVLRQEMARITKNVHVSVVEPGTYHTGFNQQVMATKYEWMNESSYFYKLIATLKKEEEFLFNFLERKTTDSIVRKIVSAVEAKNPCLRYTAPWWQALGVQTGRIFGK